MASATLAIAFIGLCAAISAAQLLSFLRQSGDAGAAVQVMLQVVDVASFFTAVISIYLQIHHGSRRGDRGAGNRTGRGRGGAGNEQHTAAFNLLSKMTIAATLITVVVSLVAIVNNKRNG